MKNQAYQDVFLTLGGAAAGANVASIVASSLFATVPLAVPIVGAIVLGSLGLFASHNDGPLFRLGKAADEKAGTG